MDKFSQCKKSMLSKLDKSTIGSWDRKIKDLCEKINKSCDFYTTSSCAGRIVLIFDKRKRNDVFVKVWHDEILFKELISELKKITLLRSVIDGSCSQPRTKSCAGDASTTKLLVQSRQGSSRKKVVNAITNSRDNFGDNNILVEKSAERDFAATNKRASASQIQIKFKQEPPILHVACRNLESAQEILKKARSSGWKRSGVISFDKNKFVVELLSTEKLEFPIIVGGEILVSKEFLKVVLKKANENLRKGWGKIEGLQKSVN